MVLDSKTDITYFGLRAVMQQRSRLRIEINVRAPDNSFGDRSYDILVNKGAVPSG